MSLSRDTLLFSIVLMLMAVQIEASGYGESGLFVLASLALGTLALLGSLVSTVASAGGATDGEAGSDTAS
jgi:hypothetical protein